MPARKDLTGKTFGEWRVLRYAGVGDICALWLCRCKCGREREVRASSLLAGTSKSCGCYRPNAAKHGHNTNEGQSPTYITWRAMLRRCSDESHNSYRLYGGRGIKVCKRWMKFENFLADMGERPEGKTLDRINGNKGYLKGNCRWITVQEQANNMSKNHPLTYQGKTQTIAEWARELGIKDGTIRSRIFRGWSTDKALST